MQLIENSSNSSVHRRSQRHLKGIEWSDRDINILIDGWKNADSFCKIARRIGRTSQSVAIKACRMGLTSRPYWNDEYLANARRRGRSRKCLTCGGTFSPRGQEIEFVRIARSAVGGIQVETSPALSSDSSLSFPFFDIGHLNAHATAPRNKTRLVRGRIRGR